MSDMPSAPPRPQGRFVILLLGLVLGLGMGLGGAYLFRAKGPHETHGAAPAKPAFQCPMHPQIMQDHPGDCPICGMALVPMDGKGATASEVHSHAEITLDPTRQQLIGLRTEPAEDGDLGGEVRAVGRVAVDETRVRKVSVKVEGFVEKLFVDFTGMSVAQGQPLFSLYSPEFVSAQQEYLLALKTRQALAGGGLQGSGGELLEASRRRLHLWDVPQEALDALERTGVPQRALTLRSPISGVVTAKNVMEGARITPADQPFEITDLGRVWVLVDVYPAEVARAPVGTAAEFVVPGMAGKAFKGRVVFVDPLVDATTRTVKLRLEFPNFAGALKPGLFGEVRLQAPSRKGLTVPLDAVVDTGTTRVVFIASGEGRFTPREVTVGDTRGERVEIRSGLVAGERVVVRANFLVDSESRLRAALAQMGKGGAQ